MQFQFRNRQLGQRGSISEFKAHSPRQHAELRQCAATAQTRTLKGLPVDANQPALQTTQLSETGALFILVFVVR